MPIGSHPVAGTRWSRVHNSTMSPSTTAVVATCVSFRSRTTRAVGALQEGQLVEFSISRIMLNGPDSGIDDPDTPKRPSAKDPASNQPVPVDEHTWARCTSVASNKRCFLYIAPDTRPDRSRTAAGCQCPIPGWP